MSVKLYRQTTHFTCGPSCTLMALKHFSKTKKFSSETEKEIWHKSRLFPFLATYPHGLAAVLASKGLNVTLVREINMPTLDEFNTFFEFEDIPEKMRKETLHVFRKSYNKQIKEAKKFGVKLVTKKPNIKMIEDTLEHGLVLALIAADYFHMADKNVERGTVIPHWVVITAADETELHVNDPYVGNVTFTRKEFEDSMKLLRKRFKIRPSLILVKER